MEHANLTGIDLTDSLLSSANLAGANVNDANLNGTLDGATSGQVSGTPAVLPADWSIVDGYLVGPYANLSGAQLEGANLSSADMENASLTSADLANSDLDSANFIETDLDQANLRNAELSGTLWSFTTCPNGTNSNYDGDTCVNDLAF